MRGSHDLGGLPAGPIDTEPHNPTFWEKQIDAMNTLLAQKELRAWDGVLSEESVAGTLYQLFVNEMMQRAMRAKAPKSWEWALGHGPHPLVPVNFFAYRRTGQLVRLLREQPPGWFEEGWSAAIGEAK